MSGELEKHNLTEPKIINKLKLEKGDPEIRLFQFAAQQLGTGTGSRAGGSGQAAPVGHAHLASRGVGAGLCYDAYRRGGQDLDRYGGLDVCARRSRRDQRPGHGEGHCLLPGCNRDGKGL